MVRLRPLGDRHLAAQRFDTIVRGAAFRSQVAVRVDLERERVRLASDVHDHRRAVRRALEHVECAEVDGADDLRRRRHDRVGVDVDPRLRACAARRRTELRDESAHVEQRREHPPCELLHLLQRPPRFALQLLEDPPRPRGIGIERTRRDLEAGGDPHQILQHAFVQGSFDPATFGIGDQRESLPRSSEFPDLAAQPLQG